MSTPIRNYKFKVKVNDTTLSPLAVSGLRITHTEDLDPVVISRLVLKDDDRVLSSWFKKRDHRTIYIEVIDGPSFVVHNAYPSRIAYSDLDAGANGSFVEQVAIAHEGIELV